ncbi:UNVERIFIED_CONTAM: hypothetical protein GTU68_033732 [Idotea baltica]|nr:hypothetical protein [Idotea baltica]
MSTKLFIGSLSWGVRDEALKEAFEQAGEVLSAVVITDRMTGRSKGFGLLKWHLKLTLKQPLICGTSKNLMVERLS